MLGSPKNAHVNTGILVFVDRLSKMAHFAAVPYIIGGEGTSTLFVDRVFEKKGFPVAIVSDRDPHSTKKF